MRDPQFPTLGRAVVDLRIAEPVQLLTEQRTIYVLTRVEYGGIGVDLRGDAPTASRKPLFDLGRQMPGIERKPGACEHKDENDPLKQPSPYRPFAMNGSSFHRVALLIALLLLPDSVFKLSFSLPPVFFSFLFHLLSFSPLYFLINFYEVSAPGSHFYHFFRGTSIMF